MVTEVALLTNWPLYYQKAQSLLANGMVWLPLCGRGSSIGAMI